MPVLRERTRSRSIGLLNSPQALRRLKPQEQRHRRGDQAEMVQERGNQRFHHRIFEKADPTSADVEAVGLRFTPQDRLLLDQPAQLRILP